MLCKNVQPGIETFASQNLIFSRQLRGDRPLFAAMAYNLYLIIIFTALTALTPLRV